MGLMEPLAYLPFQAQHCAEVELFCSWYLLWFMVNKGRHISATFHSSASLTTADSQP